MNSNQEDQKRKAESKLEELLLEGLHSGEPIIADSAHWKEKHRELAEHCRKAGEARDQGMAR